MEYLLMSAAIVFATANSAVLKKFNNKTIENTGDCFFFNGGVSVVWAIVMTVWFFASGGSSISGGAMLYGLVYGVILCSFLFLKTQSLAEGPVTFTTLVSSAAFIPATIFGVIYASESVSVLQIVGMVVMCISLVMCVNPQRSTEKLTVRWIVYCFLFFVAGGLLGMFYKVFGKSSVSAEVNGMMLSASVFSAVLFFIVGIIINKSRALPMPTAKKPALGYILTSGIVGCVYVRLNLSLSAVIPSALFFPVSNGALVVLSTLLGAVAFKERLNGLQWAGIAVGLIAIVLSGLGSV